MSCSPKTGASDWAGAAGGCGKTLVAYDGADGFQKEEAMLQKGAEMKLISQGLSRWFDSNTAVSAFLDHLIAIVVRAETHSRFLYHVIGKTRRFGLVHFKKKYVRNQLLIRKGDCRQCGFCCNLLYTCPMLTKHGRCLVYGVCRPRSCKTFPIDQRDIDEIHLCGGHCGYRFEQNLAAHSPSSKQSVGWS